MDEAVFSPASPMLQRVSALNPWVLEFASHGARLSSTRLCVSSDMVWPPSNGLALDLVDVAYAQGHGSGQGAVAGNHDGCPDRCSIMLVLPPSLEPHIERLENVVPSSPFDVNARQIWFRTGIRFVGSTTWLSGLQPPDEWASDRPRLPACEDRHYVFGVPFSLATPEHVHVHSSPVMRSAPRVVIDPESSVEFGDLRHPSRFALSNKAQQWTSCEHGDTR